MFTFDAGARRLRRDCQHVLMLSAEDKHRILGLGLIRLELLKINTGFWGYRANNLDVFKINTGFKD